MEDFIRRWHLWARSDFVREFPESCGGPPLGGRYEYRPSSRFTFNAAKTMLVQSKTLKGYTLHATDGEIGTVKEFYFDNRHWTVRYLVAETGNWLTSRKVLLSPYSLNHVVQENRDISVNLTRKQIENSPSLDTHKPVSRQFEDAYYGYYGWPTYWNGTSIWGNTPHIERDEHKWGQPIHGSKPWDPHLRSTHEVTGYHLQALDGELGHIDDFVIDDDNWTIRYLIVSTKNWWPGQKVLVSPMWIERVSWEQSKAYINLSRETIKKSPPFTELSLVLRDYEIGLHHYYNRKGYWINELAAV